VIEDALEELERQIEELRADQLPFERLVVQAACALPDS
jgi:hypothetical protein